MRKYCHSRLVLAAAAAAVTVQAQAATYDWVSGGTWDTATWSTVDGGSTYPNAIGDIANLTADITGSQTLSLPASGITLGALTLADVDGSNAYTVSSGSLTFETLSGNATINTGALGTITNNLHSPTTLNSNLDINVGSQLFATNGVWNVNGKAIVVTGGRAQFAAWAINSGNTLTGSGTITASGAGGITIGGTKAFTGTFVLNSGTSATSNTAAMTNTSGSVKDAAEIIINGYIEQGYGLRPLGGGYHQGSGTAFANNPGQRISLNTVTTNGGVVNIAGQPATVGTANPWQMGQEYVSDDTATVNFNKGYTLTSITTASNTLGTRWNIGTINHQPGGTWYIRSNALGNTSRIIADNGASLGIGAGGAAGTTTMNVVPWVLASNTNGSAQNGAPATYDTSVVNGQVVGFRALASTEFATTIIAGDTANVRTSDYGPMPAAATTTVNSLYHNSSGVSSMSAGKTLAITSGLIYFNLNGGGVAQPNTGAIDFGAAEGVVWALAGGTSAAAPNTNYIGASIAGSGGLTKSGTGILVLRGVSNTYTGKTTVAAGTLQVGDGTNLSQLGVGDIEVQAGAILKLMNGDAIDDGVTLFVNQTGLATSVGKVDIDANIVEEIGALSLGGVFQPGGYYGSSAAATAFSGMYSVIANDTYFSGTGVVQVVPEPVSMSAAMLASMALLRRRRHD